MNGNQEKSELERHYGDAGKVTDQIRSHTANPEVVAKVISDNDHAARNAGRTSDDAQQPGRPPKGKHLEDDRSNEVGKSVSVAIEVTPAASLIIAGALGYAIGWMIHGHRKATLAEAIPDYARKRA